MPMASAPPPAPAKEQTIKPVLAGIFLIIAALLAFYSGAVLLTAETIADDIPLMGDTLSDLLTICGAIFIIFGLLALLGGVFSMMRKKWGLALVGSIFALLSFGMGGIGSLLGLIALILVAISKSEFE
jgi:hypothetical protein